MRLWRRIDELDGAKDLDWPPALAYGVLGMALLFLAIAPLGQVDAEHRFYGAVFSLIAAVPWLVQLTGRHMEPLPWIAFVTIGITYYAFNPADQEVAPFVLVLAIGELAATHSVRAGLAACAAFAALMLSGELAGNYDGSLIWLMAMIVGLGTGATYVNTVRLYTELNRAQAGLAERAASDERQRIAREVHDVIAHSLAVTMLHITGARLALERGDRDDAADALAEAERLGRQSLTDVRRTVGLLASDGSANAAPEPTAAEIVDLVASYRNAGLVVTYDESGDPTRLSLAAGLGLYRIAQESLANVVKHAPGAPAAVALRVEGETATLRVTNPRPAVPRTPASGGRGLPGIKERAELLGGSATAGPTGDGWAVEVTVPIDRGSP